MPLIAGEAAEDRKTSASIISTEKTMTKKPAFVFCSVFITVVLTITGDGKAYDDDSGMCAIKYAHTHARTHRQTHAHAHTRLEHPDTHTATGADTRNAARSTPEMCSLCNLYFITFPAEGGVVGRHGNVDP